ncbi:MAG TPA: VWA domain-containing protein [Polyangiaceae bacterium]|nr:VWA domain-containing protein [Polyangiaceae bacterium]
MTPSFPIALALPALALALTLAGAAAGFAWLARRRGLGKRPLLFATALLGVLPLVYVELVWARVVGDRYLRFGRPEAAPLAALAAVYVVVRLLALRPSMGPARRALTEGLLGASVLAAGLAVLGPELGVPLDRLTVLVAVDRSRSIDLVPGAEARARAELDVAERGMGEGDRIGVIAFAAEAYTEDPPRPASADRSPQRIEVGRDATDLAAGIRRALAEVPPDSAARVVLLTDGVVTRGDPLEAAAAALAAGVPVDAVALDQKTVPDVRVVSLRAPPRADEREPIELRAVVASPKEAEIEVRVKRDGVVVQRGRARVAAGEDVVRLKEVAAEPGFHRYDLEVSALDPALDEAPEDNAATAFVRVRGPSSALVLEGDPGREAFVASALKEAGFRVEVGSTPQVPADVAGFAAYDLVVFSDVRASDLAPTQIDALAAYARDLGGGLVLLGGDRSMGPGGYARTPIEEVSPVSFDLKQERRRASLAEVIAIDYSGSMAMHVGSVTKLDLANEAAARSASLLGPGDRLGVAHVDTATKWTVPIRPVSDQAAIARAIRGVGPGGGGIFVDVALDDGYGALAKEASNLKHLLLFSDGDDAEKLGGCRGKVQGALRSGITTSVVALGRGKDVAELEALSKLGGGRFYLIEDATRLPSVFAQETVLASRSSINEVDFRPAPAAPGPALRGVELAEAPPLRGYVVTAAKARASVHLVGPESDPVLATWSVGVGRAAAFTSDLKDRWGGAWTAWPGAARLVGQLARDVARKADDPRVRLDADAGGGTLHLRATVVGDDGRAQTFRRLAVQVSGPDGFSQKLPLEAVGAGAYAAQLPLARPGTYVATAVDELSGEVVGTTGAALSAGEELRPTGTDRALLRRIAATTGGTLRDGLAGVFRDRPPPRFSYTQLTPQLALAAALALLASVASRRLAMPDALARAGARVRRALAARRTPAARPAAPAGHAADALLQAKERKMRDAPPPPPLAPPPPFAPPPFAPPPYAPPPAAPPTAPLAAEPPPQEPAPAAPARPRTAAEILLERRRGRAASGEGGPPPT